MSQQAVNVDLVIPVLNEAHVLRKSVGTVLQFLRAKVPYRCQIVIVDNGSTDGTQKVAEQLADGFHTFPQDVRFIQNGNDEVHVNGLLTHERCFSHSRCH